MHIRTRRSNDDDNDDGNDDDNDDTATFFLFTATVFAHVCSADATPRDNGGKTATTVTFPTAMG